MKTAMDVINAIERRIEVMRAEAVGPCIDALLEWSDRDAYREAMRRATSLKAVEHLRDSLVDLVETAPTAPPARVTPRPTNRRGKKANL